LPGDAALGLVGAPAPHPEPAETARVAPAAANPGVLALPIGACRMGHLRFSLSVKAFAGHMRVSSRPLAGALPVSLKST
jgi:hypothetical protein